MSAPGRLFQQGGTTWDPGLIFEHAVTLLPMVKIWITESIQMPAGLYGFRFRWDMGDLWRRCRWCQGAWWWHSVVLRVNFCHFSVARAR